MTLTLDLTIEVAGCPPRLHGWARGRAYAAMPIAQIEMVLHLSAWDT